MITYAMLPPMPSAEAPASARMHALQQLRQAESRLQDLQGTRPPLPQAQRLLVDSLSVQIAGDLARLAQSLQPASASKSPEAPPAAVVPTGIRAYQGVVSGLPPSQGRGMRVEA
jgi:hypothetical protein